jgi:hypothetical protein
LKPSGNALFLACKKVVREELTPRRDSKKGQPTVEEDPGQPRRLGKAMNGLNNDVPKLVTLARASYMLAIPEADLRRISEESGLGHLECAGNEEEMYFTNEELRQIWQIAYLVTASH